MAHLKNKQLLMCILSALMLLLTWVEAPGFPWTMLLFTLTLISGWVFTLPLIGKRFDNQVTHKVKWIVPVVASTWLTLSFWLNDPIHAALLMTLLMCWMAGLLLFFELSLEKTAASLALPTLSLIILLIIQPTEQSGLIHPLLFGIIGLLILGFFIAATKVFLLAEIIEEKQNTPLPANLAKQIKKADEAIHESSLLKEKIKGLKVDLSAAEMAKMEFLATMSHEIRTPLNGIVPLIDIVMDTELNTFQKDYLTTAHTSATQMQKLIDDLLDYSKVEAGKLTTEITGLKVRNVVEEVIDNLSSSAERKGLEVSTHIDEQINPLLRGDPIRVRQVLTNILSNAIKFSDHGKIIVDVKKIKNFTTKEVIRFTVKDQGIGISPDQTEKLFSAFTQGDTSSTRKFGGTGLGLAISKKIVELLKGQMGVESKLGVGSTFWFEIPFGKSAGDSIHDDNEVHQHHAVLLNTNPILFKRIQAELEHASIPAQVSLNYQHAISRIQAARGNKDNKTVLLFIDFDTNAKIFRQLLLLVEKEELKDVWQTDQAESFESENKSEDHKAKEVTAVNLKDISDTVLLVEDNEVNLKVAQKLIDYIGFPFDVAENGMIALSKAKKNRYRLILMDCQMPVMDGYFCTKRIRNYEKNHGLNHTPIIAMTANAMLGDKEKCLASGMDDYMSKPLNRYILEKTLKKWDPFAVQQKTTTTQDSETPDGQINAKWLNQKALEEIKTFMGDETNSLLDLFQQESPNMLNQLNTFGQTQDFTDARQVAHTLKSTAANIGASGFSHYCKKIEAAAIEKDKSGVEKNILSARKAYVLTVKEIKKYQATAS